LKTTRILLAIAALAAFAGCSQMEFSPAGQGDPARILTGEVDIPDVSALPPDTSVTVRVVDMNAHGQGTDSNQTLDSAAPPGGRLPPTVLGSQTITSPGTAPVAFHVEYRAEDDVLIRGLNIEVRVSYGGKVQYYNRNRYAVALGNATSDHRITVERSGP
jgi:uncharacterized lipoprotein YbaY